jgi:hypothetical protein
MQEPQFDETVGKTIKVIAPMGSGCVLFSKLLLHVCDDISITSGQGIKDEWFGNNWPEMMDQEDPFVYILRDPVDSVTQNVKIFMKFKEGYDKLFQEEDHLQTSISIALGKYEMLFTKSKEKENIFKITYESMFTNFFNLELNDKYSDSITIKDIYPKIAGTHLSFWIPDNHTSAFTEIEDKVRNNEAVKEMQKKYFEYKKEIEAC